MIFAIHWHESAMVYMCSPSWSPPTPPSPSHSSGSAQCTSPEHPVSCIKPGLAICFRYDNIHVSMLFSQIIPPSPSPRVWKTVLYICVSFAVSHTGLLLLLLLLLSRFSHVWLCMTPETAAHQAPPSLGFSRQEHWSGLPFPSPMYESEKWKWSHSVVSDSSWPHGLQPTRLLHPWDFPGKSTGVGCHRLLWYMR